MRGPAGTPQGPPVPVGPVGRSASVGPSGRRAPLAVALDAPDAATAVRWARSVTPHVAMLKVGLELFYREGPAVIVALRAAGALADPAGAGLDGREPPSSGALPELFLDLKLHDIPATVAGGIRSVTPLRPRFVTVHASGGPTMIRAAVEAAGEAASAAGGGAGDRAGDRAGADAGGGVWTGPSIAAVTVLTSLSGADLTAVGLAGPALAAVLRLAELAVAAGATALVCSPSEVSEVRRAVGTSVTLITPGVRPRGSAWADQSRVATPGEAVAAGADLVVVGRPITGAADPGVAAAAVAAELVRPR